MAEHDEALRDAREHVESKDGQPLDPLPDTYAAGRSALHRVAECVLRAKRLQETGNEIALHFTPGGFGTPVWKNGQASGEPGSVRVDRCEVVLHRGMKRSARPSAISERWSS